MRTAAHYFYCDRTISDGEKCVLLLGGFTGYQNFGDILQLKHAISFHKSITGLKPVVICDIACIPGPGYPEKLHERLGVDYIIFFSREYCDAVALNLKVMESPVHIPYFHTYGGGFLNRYWVQVYLSLAPDLIDFFGVGHYLLSGQQVDHAVAGRLKHFFEAYKPLLIGCRDEESVEVVKKIAPYAAAYSFDDAFESLQDLTSCMSLTEDIDGRQTIMLHLNLSRYCHDNEAAREGLEVYKDALRMIKSHYGDKDLDFVLLMAYNDLRLDEVKDTLAVLVVLEDEFDFTGARILNLANLAFYNKAGGLLSKTIKIPRSALLITASYHTAMMGLDMGLRTWLFEENEYYSQKHAGLHMERRDLKSFLEHSYESVWTESNRRYFRQAREKWLELLSGIYLRKPEERSFCVDPDLNVPMQPFVYKMDRNDLYRHIGHLDRHIINLEAQIKEREKQIDIVQAGGVPGRSFADIIGSPLREVPEEYRYAAVKILIVSGIAGVPYIYRCLNMKEELDFCGYRNVTCKYVHEVEPLQDAKEFNLIILNRPCEAPAPNIIELIERSRERGVIVVFTTDDLVTDHAIDKYIELHNYPNSALYNFHRGLDESRHVMQRCDAVISSTNYLRTCILPYNRNVYVLENALNEKQVRKAGRLMQESLEKKRRRKETVIGYFSGWIYDHEPDFAVVSSVLRRVLQRYPDARLRIVGFLDIGEEFREVEARVEQVDFVPFEVLSAIIADVDINIAPLADNPRKRSKSSIKFLEAGILGVPTVAAGLDPYNDIIAHGEDGLLCSNEEEWFTHLSALIEAPQLRHEIGMKAYAKVRIGHTTLVRSRTCRKILQSIIGKSCHETFRHPDAVEGKSLSSTVSREELARTYLKGHGIAIGERDPRAIVQPDIVASVGQLSAIGDSNYDFLMANHLLEHCPNPVRTLKELHRVTKKHDSFIYLAMPHATSRVTPVSHFAAVYFRRVAERKATHVFTEESFLELLQFMDEELYVRFEIVERFADEYGFLFILKPVY